MSLNKRPNRKSVTFQTKLPCVVFLSTCGTLDVVSKLADDVKSGRFPCVGTPESSTIDPSFVEDHFEIELSSTKAELLATCGLNTRTGNSMHAAWLEWADSLVFIINSDITDMDWLQETVLQSNKFIVTVSSQAADVSATLHSLRPDETTWSVVDTVEAALLAALRSPRQPATLALPIFPRKVRSDTIDTCATLKSANASLRV